MRQCFRKKIILLACLLGPLATAARADDETPDDAAPDERRAAVTLGRYLEHPAVRQAIEAIAHNYLVDVKSIFKQACFDCHTNLTQYPWYYTVPGIKAKIDNDIADAREQIDFSNDYPFLGNGYLTDDLQAIAQSLRQKTMPPLDYTVMHWRKNLRDDQRQKVLSWVEDSLMLLGQAGYLSVAHDQPAPRRP